MKAYISILLMMLSVAVPAAPTYTGMLTYPSGITATGSWANQATYFSWTVSQQTYNSTLYWRYEYTFSVYHKEISHLILQTSNNFTANEMIGLVPHTVYELKLNKPKEGNPLMPNDLFGIKFDNLSGTEFRFSFYSPREPMLGDFYAKDGKVNGDDIVAWNKGFGQNYTISLSDAAQWGKILVPDTAVIIPAPAAVILAGIGTALVGYLRRRNTV